MIALMVSFIMKLRNLVLICKHIALSIKSVDSETGKIIWILSIAAFLKDIRPWEKAHHYKLQFKHIDIQCEHIALTLLSTKHNQKTVNLFLLKLSCSFWINIKRALSGQSKNTWWPKRLLYHSTSHLYACPCNSVSFQYFAWYFASNIKTFFFEIKLRKEEWLGLW